MMLRSSLRTAVASLRQPVNRIVAEPIMHQQAVQSGGLHLWQRYPAGDCPTEFPRLCIVRNARKRPAQVNGTREFTVLFVGGADRRGLRFSKDEHWPQARRTSLLPGVASALSFSAADVLGKIVFNDGTDVLS